MCGTYKICTFSHEPDPVEWDPIKAKSNKKKHGVSFEEAQSAFFDEQGLLLEDPQPPP